jgi:hypothetical protein
VFPARYELNSCIAFRKRLVSKRLINYVFTSVEFCNLLTRVSVQKNILLILFIPLFSSSSQYVAERKALT